jgi:hypothetical protein
VVLGQPVLDTRPDMSQWSVMPCYSRVLLPDTNTHPRSVNRNGLRAIASGHW